MLKNLIPLRRHLLPMPQPPFFPSPFFASYRPLSSSPSFTSIDSKESYTAALQKAEADKLPAIFYFTAAWCGPCRAIAPKVEELNKKYPHVTTYKIDIDQEELRGVLNNLKISGVPTFHFFQNGKKEAELIGADAARIKEIFENLYKLD